MPVVVWGDAQGHLEVVEGLWPPIDGADKHPEEAYPPQLVVMSDADVPSALRALLSNVSLRVKASEKGLRLADQFHLDRIVDHLVAILLAIEARKAARE